MYPDLWVKGRPTNLKEKLKFELCKEAKWPVLSPSMAGGKQGSSQISPIGKALEVRGDVCRVADWECKQGQHINTNLCCLNRLCGSDPEAQEN